jgi:hypothetical protein
MRLLLLLLTPALLSALRLNAAPPQPPAAKLIEFQSAPLVDALRQLGRDAKVQLVLDETIAGTVTIRFESASPMEALRVLAESKGLALSESAAGSGIYFVVTPLTQAQRLGALDSPAFPAAVARYKRRLFEALCREGFSEQQALAIVAAERTPIADVPIIKPQ